MSAELTMHTILSGAANLVALVGTKIYEETWPATDDAGAAITFPLVVYQRIPGGQIMQPVTGRMLGTDARFQIRGYAEDAAGARTLGSQLAAALVDGIGTVSDVTMLDRWGTYEPDSELYSVMVECRLLIAHEPVGVVRTFGDIAGAALTHTLNLGGLPAGISAWCGLSITANAKYQNLTLDDILWEVPIYGLRNPGAITWTVGLTPETLFPAAVFPAPGEATATGTFGGPTSFLGYTIPPGATDVQSVYIVDHPTLALLAVNLYGTYTLYHWPLT